MTLTLEVGKFYTPTRKGYANFGQPYQCMSAGLDEFAYLEGGGTGHIHPSQNPTDEWALCDQYGRLLETQA